MKLFFVFLAGVIVGQWLDTVQMYFGHRARRRGGRQ